MKLLLIDGNSLVYRAFFALPTDMATASGQVTNAVYGFATMLVTMVKDQNPDGVLVVFDRKEPTFRHEAIPEYKAQREKTPEILLEQLQIARELLDVLGIAHREAVGFEGDDIIATVAARAVSESHDVIIVTGDRDAYQLVKDPHIKVMYNKRGVSDYALYDEAGIVERTGVHPSKYADYAAMRGDPSDNLDGVPGVGEKTAAKLLNQYGDLAGVLAHAADQTPKLRAALEEHGERVVRNAKMMVLRTDVPVELEFSTLVPSPDLTRSKALFESLEFKNMQSRVKGAFDRFISAEAPSQASEAELAQIQIAEISDEKELIGVLADLAELVIAASWSGEPGRSSLMDVALVQDLASGRVAVIPANVFFTNSIVELLNKKPLVAHNAKPILRWALGDGVDLQSLVLDTAIASYIVNPARSDYDIESVAEDLLDSLPMRSENQQGEQGTLDFAGNWGTADRESVARAAYLCALIAAPIRSRLVEEKSSQLYSDIENPLVRVLARMEVLGVAVNKEQLTSINKRLTEETESFTAQLHKLAGRAFNLNSPTQLREILYEERGLTPGKKTKTGYSTDAATLEKLRPEWPEFIEPLLRYRELEKLRSTYGEGLIAVVDPADGRIHATFNQTVARTGRLSSEHPNLHNIPIRSDEGRIFRTAFVATNGAELLVADYNQIELRCIAHLADDPGLIEAFTAGVDVHTATAARVFGVKPDAVTSEQRSRAKMVAYGLAYGMEAYGLSQRLAIPVDEAAGILDSFFGAFPAIKSYMERTVADAKKMKYTETLFGRRRPIPELSSDNFRIRQAGERMAMNAAIQGLAADIFKIALVRIDEALTTQNLCARIVLQVHDEVLVEAPVNERDTVEKIVLDIMRSAAELRVPLEVNAAWGTTWAEAK